MLGSHAPTHDPQPGLQNVPAIQESNFEIPETHNSQELEPPLRSNHRQLPRHSADPRKKFRSPLMHNDLLVAQAEPNFGCAGSRLLAAVGSPQHLGEKAKSGRPHWFRLFTNRMA
jgi:hypothetical protein